MERKSKILEIIRSLDLPNNPLDDIIDQVPGESCGPSFLVVSFDLLLKSSLFCYVLHQTSVHCTHVMHW